MAAGAPSSVRHVAAADLDEIVASFLSTLVRHDQRLKPSHRRAQPLNGAGVLDLSGCAEQVHRFNAAAVFRTLNSQDAVSKLILSSCNLNGARVT